MFYQDSTCCRNIYINKYGTRTRVAKLMCDQFGGDCSEENEHSKEGYRPRNGDNLRDGDCYRPVNSPWVSDCLGDGDSPDDCGSPWHLWADLF